MYIYWSDTREWEWIIRIKFRIKKNISFFLKKKKVFSFFFFYFIFFLCFIFLAVILLYVLSFTASLSPQPFHPPTPLLPSSFSLLQGPFRRNGWRLYSMYYIIYTVNFRRGKQQLIIQFQLANDTIIYCYRAWI